MRFGLQALFEILAKNNMLLRFLIFFVIFVRVGDHLGVALRVLA